MAPRRGPRARRFAALLVCILALGLGTAARPVHAHKHGSSPSIAAAAVVNGQHAAPRPEHAVVTAAAPTSSHALLGHASTVDSSPSSNSRTAGSPPARGPPVEALA